MIIKFDQLNRFETPSMLLCNPGSVKNNNGSITNIIGVLEFVSDVELVLNFNSTSELNFRIQRVNRPNDPQSQYIQNLYLSVKNRRLIFLDNIGYFSIENVSTHIEGDVQYKDVSAVSIESEIENKNIPYIANGTYVFYNPLASEDKGILDKIVSSIPLWTIDHVDNILLDKYRTFEDIDTSTNCLSFMISNMQNAYECIFIFDYINRKVNVYDQSEFSSPTSILLSNNDVVNNIDITENSSDVYTAISVIGDSDDVNISALNPTGNNIIYNFDYYISWMPSALGQKVQEWQDDISDIQPTYKGLNESYYDALTSANTYQLELDKLSTQITMYTRCKNNIVAEKNTSLVNEYNQAIIKSGGAKIETQPTIDETIEYINDLIDDANASYSETYGYWSVANAQAESLQSQISSMHSQYALEKYFTSQELESLSSFIYEGSYSDEYITTTDSMTLDQKFDQMQTLYSRAVLQLEKISQPSQEFSIDVDNFIFEKEFNHWTSQLQTGCAINVELNDGDVAQIFLSSFTINYEDCKLTMSFGNRINKYDTKSLFEDVLGKVSKTANTVSYLKEVVAPITNGDYNKMKEAIQTSRNITMTEAMASTNQEVIIDGSGITCRKVAGESFEPEQIKITGKNIAFTEDQWDSCSTAIGQIYDKDGNDVGYGINAETIIGDIIIGNNLRIFGSDGNQILNANGVNNLVQISISGVSSDLGDVKEIVDNTTARVNNIETDGVKSVKTTTNYTFDENGLNISESGSEITNLIDNTGMYVRRAGGDVPENILVANSDGVNAFNLTSRVYLIVGNNSRFENYNDNRTACFYIGESEE